ncbi:aminotransferase class V-fold PLP-dependent enzyme [uncultured Ferrovibrio sp.]|jgi:selenocysteine lyase/cysteine desulfurase|uniref:aminotransferase class V-fold PLP-dependent enzyme n=1 Tax=uncultured Ferrovibrio sp. TaxID=1576913 RepID=UPI00262F7FE8|nr:aminotransferase class V-fold PLP-dependent enzyme [uncultured Ferrovibrio sp.]
MTKPQILPSQRHLFDIPADVAYLNCAYMSPLSRAAVAAGEAGMRRKARPWEVTPQDFFTDSERVRALFAQIINATADDIALVPAASYGIAVAAQALPLQAGQSVLTLAEQFPSNVYRWMEKARAANARYVTVPRPADDDWTAAVLSHIDRSTAIVALPHCHWTDGGLLDLIAIRKACNAVGAALCIDATQSLGALPFDVAEIDPDFLAVGGYKWLMGPYSFGYLYVARRWQQAVPLEQNWIARKDSENFAGLVDYKSEYQPGARRFDVGERSNFALTPAAIAALQMLLDWGIENIQATLAARNAAIAERAEAELGLSSAPAHRRAGHFLGLRFGGEVPVDLPARLAAKKVYVSVRGRSMRVTPHLYNSDEDVERLFSVMKTALKR